MLVLVLLRQVLQCSYYDWSKRTPGIAASFSFQSVKCSPPIWEVTGFFATGGAFCLYCPEKRVRVSCVNGINCVIIYMTIMKLVLWVLLLLAL